MVHTGAFVGTPSNFYGLPLETGTHHLTKLLAHTLTTLNSHSSLASISILVAPSIEQYTYRTLRYTIFNSHHIILNLLPLLHASYRWRK